MGSSVRNEVKMPAGIILILIIAFIGNRIFGLYKDETTTRILEEAGAIKPRRPNARAGGRGYPSQVRKGQLTPYQIQFRKDRAILKQMAAREARVNRVTARATRRILSQYGLEG